MKHKHHIIPRHVGGTDDPSNLIELTIEEHAEAHRKLYEEHGRPEDKLAWKALAGMLTKEEIIWEILSMAGKKGGAKGGRAGKGRKFTKEHRNKIGNAVSGENNGMFGQTLTIEHRNKISQTIKKSINIIGNENWQGSKNLVKSAKEKIKNGTHPSQISWVCEYCNKEGKGKSNYTRCHGEKCKLFNQHISS